MPSIVDWCLRDACHGLVDSEAAVPLNLYQRLPECTRVDDAFKFVLTVHPGAKAFAIS